MIHIGTCSWTERTLIKSGEFYPKGLSSAEDRLKYYASKCDTVEIDSTYYAIPDKRSTYLWADRTPDDFIFHVKVYGALTGHGIDPNTLPKDILNLLSHENKTKQHIYVKESFLLKVMAERFTEVLTPMIKTHKLGVLVFQFPPWFQYKTVNLDYILTCKELMQGLPIAVEFRHGSWLEPDRLESVLHFLREHQLTYIIADEPQYGNLATIPFLPDITTDIAYFRFHGRNKEHWLEKRIETSLRFAYLYSEDELMEFIPSMKNVDKKARVTYAMFNNCHGSSAIKNALRLKELLSQKSV